MLFLYELKLLKYHPLTPETWIAIIGAYFSFLIGILTYKYANSIYKIDSDIIRSNFFNELETNLKFIKITIIVTASLSLLGALQHWLILFGKYGSLPSILINANEIYRLRVQDEIPGVLPYISAFGFVAVFFSAVESAVKGKFTFLSFYSILGVVMKEFAMLGRAGIFNAFIEYFVVLYFIRYYLKLTQPKSGISVKKNNLTASIIVMVVLFTLSAALVKNVRGAFESYRSSTKELNQLKGGFLITPSIYLYFSSHIGVFSRYLWEDSEENNIGENTFLPFYRIISKFGIVEPPSYYQKGYNIPMWTNTGTYLRELYSDFGPLGIFMIPYLLGLITTFYWFRFFKFGNPFDLLFLSHLFILIVLSFLMMTTRSSNFLISFGMIYVILSLNKKYYIPKLLSTDSGSVS
jgi:oligosaccharide repeat unit polymerase